MTNDKYKYDEVHISETAKENIMGFLHYVIIVAGLVPICTDHVVFTTNNDLAL